MSCSVCVYFIKLSKGFNSFNDFKNLFFCGLKISNFLAQIKQLSINLFISWTKLRICWEINIQEIFIKFRIVALELWWENWMLFQLSKESDNNFGKLKHFHFCLLFHFKVDGFMDLFCRIRNIFWKLVDLIKNHWMDKIRLLF